MSDKTAKYTRLDDYGLITYLSMKGFPVRANEGLFEVAINLGKLDTEIMLYKESAHKKFDDTSKKLKQIRKQSISA